MRTATILFCALAAVACHGEATRSVADAETAETATDAAPPIDEGFRERLLEIAAEYTGYGRVDDLSRWAPELCRVPPPAKARMSTSRDPETHGKKLYSLLARHRDAYMTSAESPQPTGQVIVKESWVPEELPLGEPMPQARTIREPRDAAVDFDAVPYFHPYAERDGRVYRARQRGPLFVMFKLDAATPETDEGWVYGTVETNGEVTSAGRVQSCMDCHLDAPRDRMFGPQ